MIRKFQMSGLALATSMLAMACTNPTIDPASTFYAEGKALTASGDPLVGAEVKVIRYFHAAKLLRPDVDDLFECSTTECGYPGLDLEIGLVSKTTTDMDGGFSMEFKGEDIAGVSGITDERGRVEGSNVVIVIKDPNDMNGFAGVFTNDYTYQQSDKRWDPGNLTLWNANATANVGASNMSGMVGFSWNKIDNMGSSAVDTTYRLEVRGGGSRLVQRCRAGSSLETGGCDEDMMSGALSMDVSAFSLYNFYSDRGDFKAYIQGNGVDMNWRSKFTVEGMFEDPSMNRDVIPADGAWAVSASGNEMLDATDATDGMPSTRLELMTPAKSIYLQLPTGSLVTDAGLLNTVVDNAYSTCVVLEFSGTSYNDVSAAGESSSGDWVQKGRFCGGNGANNEMSALVSFDTSASMGQSAAWMRFRLEDDGMGMASAAFIQIGEVAVYKQR
jgi:hypothetical protein